MTTSITSEAQKNRIDKQTKWVTEQMFSSHENEKKREYEKTLKKSHKP